MPKTQKSGKTSTSKKQTAKSAKLTKANKTAKASENTKPVEAVKPAETTKAGKDENFKFLNIRFPVEIAENLTEVSRARNTSVSSFIRKAVEKELSPKPEPVPQEEPTVQENPVVKRSCAEICENLQMIRDSETLIEYAVRVGLAPITESTTYFKITPEFQAQIFAEVENATRFRRTSDSQFVIYAFAEVLGNVTNLDYKHVLTVIRDANHTWDLNDFVPSKSLWDEPGKVENISEVITPWLIRNYAVILGYTFAKDGRTVFLLKAEGFVRALGLLGLSAEKQDAFFKCCTQCELDEDGKKGTIPTVIQQIEAVFAS